MLSAFLLIFSLRSIVRSMSVCVSVSEHIPGTTRPHFATFSVRVAFMLPVAVTWWGYRQHCNVMYFRFVDIVVFYYNWPVMLSLNSMGPTPTPTRTLWMRLSCNFVNVYTIIYHVQYSTRTHTRVHARIPNGHPREEKRASDKSPLTSQPTSARAGHANFCARILARKSARKSVSVSLSVSVPWNLSFTTTASLQYCHAREIPLVRAIGCI